MKKCMLCKNKHHAKGFCVTHYHKYITPKKKKQIKCMLCEKPFHARGFCNVHYNEYVFPKKGYRTNKICACGCGTRLKDNRSIWAKGHSTIKKEGCSYAGYIFQHTTSHPRKAKKKNNIGQHILIAERALGKYLPRKAIVHHVDGNGYNNKNDNLVICENRSYHQLLHARKRAYEAIGDVHQRPCGFCKKYSPISELSYRKGRINNNYWWHPKCMRDYEKKIYRIRKEKRANGPAII
ncbi:MAG TPA: HNH endonuclease [Spirochaetota bacterium]|jgi:hypothetical protein|nr:HNH endonuclease [Spirochaetota bacterium]